MNLAIESLQSELDRSDEHIEHCWFNAQRYVKLVEEDQKLLTKHLENYVTAVKRKEDVRQAIEVLRTSVATNPSAMD